MSYNILAASPTMPALLSTVVIVPSALAPTLRTHLAADSTVVIFAASEALHALEAIVKRPPKIVVLDSEFARTTRGATLIAQIKSDARLIGVELRIVIQAEANLPVLLGQPATSAGAALAAASRPLDRCGTRRAARFPMKGAVLVLVNGEPSQLVNLSVTGAQILAAIRMEPQQRTRVTLRDGSAETRFYAVIAWSALEMSGQGAQYRAGLEFTDPDPHILEAFCLRHGTSPDRVFCP